jgi:hypothetical protein
MISPGFCGALVVGAGAAGAGFSGPLIPHAGSAANISAVANAATARVIEPVAGGQNARMNSRNMVAES